MIRKIIHHAVTNKSVPLCHSDMRQSSPLAQRYLFGSGSFGSGFSASLRSLKANTQAARVSESRPRIGCFAPCALCVQAARVARAARESGAMHPALFSGSVAQLRFACLPLAASERSETEPPENRVLCTLPHAYSVHVV